jgi:hypothetical protein
LKKANSPLGLVPGFLAMMGRLFSDWWAAVKENSCHEAPACLAMNRRFAPGPGAGSVRMSHGIFGQKCSGKCYAPQAIVYAQRIFG